jgi:uncharacterized protein YceH (UPF0502 family)
MNASMELTAEELRVLGCLVEKEATVPDAYPLSTNALQLACNQRTSRDPIVDFDEDTVTRTLLSLREHGLARTARGEGSRVYKHAHSLDGTLGLSQPELAVLSILMLRGPQTVGELRTRAERQHFFDSLESVQGVLDGLAGRPEPLAQQLDRQPGQKEARWRHLLGDHAEPATPTAPPSAVPTDEAGLAEQIDELRAEVSELQERLSSLEDRLRAS